MEKFGLWFLKNAKIVWFWLGFIAMFSGSLALGILMFPGWLVWLVGFYFMGKIEDRYANDKVE